MVICTHFLVCFLVIPNAVWQSAMRHDTIKGKRRVMVLDSMEIYVHIPFCKRKCLYCDFASCAGREDSMEHYCRDLIKEIRLRAGELGPVPISTAYIGGGTPSVLPSVLLSEVLDCLFDAFPPMPDAEITCELNPGTLTEDFLHMLYAHRVNRLSLGAQARQDRLLQTLGRIHCWKEVEDSVLMARQAGFENLNIDLMFGLPLQTREEWLDTLKAALELHPEHISCYGLILEEGTALYEMEAKGQLPLPGEDTERGMYNDAHRLLKKAGLFPYEISNFAKPDRECRHNLGYWQGANYLGLGAAAHSRLDCDPNTGAYKRFGNTRNLEKYMESMDRGVIPVEEYKVIPFREAEFETLMLGLRVVSGVKEADFLRRHGRTLREAFGDKISPLVNKGLLTYSGGCLMLTRRGMDVQNAVLVELMD
jgi:oxygen-independent coproporphyrinogen-3 oxidase